MDVAMWWLAVGTFVTSAGAAAVAWWQAIAAGRSKDAASAALAEANEIARQAREASLRDALRAQLREWFATLSRTAPPAVGRAGPRLRASIEEEAHARQFNEVLTALDWATTMHEETHRQAEDGRLSALHAHNLRIVVKRRFRQFIAVWANERAQGVALIDGYTSKGWPALLREPGWRESTRDEPVGAVAGIGFLEPQDSWSRLPPVE